MKKVMPVLVIALIAVSVAVVQGNTDDLARQDREAITQCALDYIDGYYTADEARMERAVHAELSKRIIRTDPNTGRSVLQNMNAEQLVGIVANARGPVPEDQRQSDVTILDVYENVASVKIVASGWIDYLHVGRVDGEWKIIPYCSPPVVLVMWNVRATGERCGAREVLDGEGDRSFRYRRAGQQLSVQ